jgi:hypothetical protein
MLAMSPVQKKDLDKLEKEERKETRLNIQASKKERKKCLSKERKPAGRCPDVNPPAQCLPSTSPLCDFELM